MKKDLDWSSLGFGYIKTDYRYISNFKDGKWDEGILSTDDTVTISESAGVLQYAFRQPSGGGRFVHAF